MEVDSFGGTGWPWSWYLRDDPVSYPDMSRPDYVPTGSIVVVSALTHDRVQPLLRRYVGRRFHERVWWAPDWGAASAGDWARWLVTRQVWSPLGYLDEWVYVRKDLVETYGLGPAAST